MRKKLSFFKKIFYSFYYGFGLTMLMFLFILVLNIFLMLFGKITPASMDFEILINHNFLIIWMLVHGYSSINYYKKITKDPKNQILRELDR